MLSNEWIVELVEGFISWQTKKTHKRYNYLKHLNVQSIWKCTEPHNLKQHSSIWFSSLHKLISTRPLKITTTRSRLINKYLHKMFSVFYPYDCVHPHALVHIYKYTSLHKKKNVFQIKTSSFTMFHLGLNPKTHSFQNEWKLANISPLRTSYSLNVKLSFVWASGLFKSLYCNNK